MKKYLLGILFLGVIGIIIFLGLEHKKSILMTLDEDKIGKNISQVYKAENRDDHIGHLQTYEHADGSIRYLDVGLRDGETIVLLHGTPTSSYLWRKIIPGLSDAGYRVVVPDMLGYGASDKPKGRELYSIKKQSERISSLIDYLDIDTFVLGGHDQGSLWMRDIATNFPTKTSKLIVFNSIFDKDGFHAPAMYGKRSPITKIISSIRGNKFVGKIVAQASFGGGVVHQEYMTDEILKGYLIPLYDGASRTNYYFISDFEEVFTSLQNYKSKLLNMQIPAIVIWGKQDSILSADEQIPVLQEYLKIEQQDIYILDNAKHFIQEEESKKIVTAINDFLAKQ